MNSLYYQPSGRFTLGGVIGMLLIGALAAVPLAFLYVYAIWYIPFIYINFAVTLGFGFGLGWVLRLMVRTGKLRNPKLAGGLAVVVALWAWYVQWCVYLALLAGAGETESLGSRASFTHATFQEDIFLGLLVSPATVLELLGNIGSEGLWSLFGVTVSGFFLYLIWLVELGIIVALAWILPLLEAGKPFSELANEWAEKITLPRRSVHFADIAAVKTALEAADWEHLQPRSSEGVTATSPFGRLHFYQAPADPDCCYLSLENVTIEVDDKGKTSEKSTDVVEYLRVPPRMCTELRARFAADAPVLQDAATNPVQ